MYLFVSVFVCASVLFCALFHSGLTCHKIDLVLVSLSGESRNGNLNSGKHSENPVDLR